MWPWPSHCDLDLTAELSGPIAKALTPMEKLKMKDDPEWVENIVNSLMPYDLIKLH